MLRRFALLVRTLASTAGKDAFARAMPLYMGIGLVAAIVFGGNGMHPAQLTGLAGESFVFRVALWATWLLLGTPAARALLRAPATFFLRALPVPRVHLLSAHALLLAIAELPWVVLWAFGAGALAGAAACVAALAAHCMLLARPRGGREIAALSLLVGAILLGAPAPLLLACAAPALAVGLRAAFVRAPEVPVGRAPSLVSSVSPGASGALLALSLAYLAALLRGHRAVLVRGLALAAVGALAAAAWIRTSEPLAEVQLAAASLVALAPCALCASAGFSGPVLREERRIVWLLDACGASAPLRAGAAASAVAAPAVVLALGHGAAASALTRAAPAAALRLLAGAALAGLLLSAVALGCVRWSQRQDGRDSSRVLLSVLAAVAAATATAWTLGELALAAWAPVAALLAWRAGVARAAGVRRAASPAPLVRGR
ncbi:hypothetical protein [Sorangium cellulosum]|uniref:hypothetical protein n=1 Tax=Sorangium cellulosum TaxID=56 RepID=UPI001F3326DF|nr:hypothetical protein [Sorangium cellulosum]